MNKKSNPASLPKLFLFVLIIFSFLFLNSISILYANLEPIPISGTPKLNKPNNDLIKEIGPPNTIQLERNLGKILTDLNYCASNVSFDAFDFYSNAYYQTTATCQDAYLMRHGYYLYIYVEDRLYIPFSSIINIRWEIINNILYVLTNYFGSPPARNITILILDIRDDYNPAIGNITYVSGYFDPNYPFMLYFDANPGVPGTMTFFGTFAHEFQHLIHYHIDRIEETWVNEGLSGLARYLCGYGHPVRGSSQRRHIEAFARNPNTSLTVWDDSLANYGATYLFMLYLWKHYGGPTIIRKIVANQGRGITGINHALWLSGYAVTFNSVFRNWVIANYLNNSSVYNGIYGYDDSFDGVSPAPGNMQITKTHTTYPARGSGLIYPYAAEYTSFCFLGGIYDVFVLVAHSTVGSSYSYSGNLGSFILYIDGISDQMCMSGVQESTANLSPIVLLDLSAHNRISPFGGLSWDSREGGCFIATAFYGSTISNEITILREFRDRFLLTNNLGRMIVNLYYGYSPAMANFISPSEKLRLIARTLIYPIIGLSYALLRFPLSVALSVIIFWALLLRKLRPGKKKKAIIL